jgi:uncharacterized RDD family membrane protein YckC
MSTPTTRSHEPSEPGVGADPATTTAPSAPPYASSGPASYPASPSDYGAPPAVAGVPPLPPGVTLAPVGRRIGAYFLGILLMIVTLGIGYIIWGLIVWRRGTTPALSVLKMRCVKVGTGSRATFGTMALREIVGGIVEGILSWITELVSLILFLARDDHRCLHDLIGGTVVVYDPNGRLDSVP